MKRKLTTVQRIRGLRGAIASSRTPAHLKPHISRQLHRLEAQRPRRRKRAKSTNKAQLMEWLTP